MSPRVTEEHKESRRSEILAAALQVFKRKGFEPTTMKDIVEESGMSRGGVYMYFSSTEELFLELVKQMDHDSVGELESRFDEQLSTWAAVETMLSETQARLNTLEDELVPVIYEYFMTGWREKTRQPFLLERYNHGIEEIESFLQKGVERGEFQPLLPVRVLAQSIVTFVDGLSIGTIYVGTEVVDLEGQMQALRLFLRSVLQVGEK